MTVKDLLTSLFTPKDKTAMTVEVVKSELQKFNGDFPAPGEDKLPAEIIVNEPGQPTRTLVPGTLDYTDYLGEALYRHPHYLEGVISLKDKHRPIIAGLVQLPEEVGTASGFARLTRAEARQVTPEVLIALVPKE